MICERKLQATGGGTFVPLSFRPGEAFQFGWSEDLAVLGDARTKLRKSHIKLAHGRSGDLPRAAVLSSPPARP